MKINCRETIFNNWFYLFILWIHYVNKVSCQYSPCPDIFSFAYDEDNSIVGKVTIKNPAYGVNKLLVNMLLKTRGTASSFGKIDLTNGYDAERIITQGGSLLYKIKFPSQNPLPSVVSLNFRGQDICSGNPDRSVSAGESLSKIQLQHTLKVNPSSDAYYAQQIPSNQPQQYEQPQQVYRTTTSAPIQYDYDRQQEQYNYQQQLHEQQLQQQYESSRTTTKRPRLPPRTESPAWIPPSDDISNDENSIECGVPGIQTVDLIYNGDSITHGEWPWIVAIFKKQKSKLEYICSGSLISPTITVSAAHCTHEKSSKAPPGSFLLRIGIHNIHGWEEDEGKSRSVKEVIYPPEFQPKTPTNVDLAILIMTNPVPYTKYIKPICLWSGDNTVRVTRGTVVGWGKDELGNDATPEPRITRVPIVTQEVCYNSNRNFRLYLNEYNFCAGNRDGSGPCNGDSGGGLYTYRNRHFELKGIVSKSLTNLETNNGCNVYEYVMYTDAAKFAPWLRRMIQEYES